MLGRPRIMSHKFDELKRLHKHMAEGPNRNMIPRARRTCGDN